MAPLHVPPEGLRLRHQPKPSDDQHAKDPTQVIRLDLVETVTKDILRALRNNEQVRLRCGKRPIVQVGKKSISLESTVDAFPSEIFTKSTGSARSLYFSGRSSHMLEVQKAEDDTAKADEALATLESTLKSLQQERASNETSLKGGKEDLRLNGRKDNKPSPMLSQGSALRKEHFLGGLNRSTPSSPFLSASYSPRAGPTSAPLSSGTSSKDRLRLDAIRIPLVHLLAVRPMSPKALCEKLHASTDDVEKLLDKVSWECKAGDGKRELKEKSYRELDVWKFPYRTEEERKAAIDHAIQAYDRMRVEKKDPLWQLLLPQEERGKGKLLSRLNFDKPPPSQATPKLDRAADDGNDSKNEMSDRDAVKVRPKKDKDTGAAQKAQKDKVAIGSKGTSKTEGASSTKVKEAAHSQARPPKSDGKFKSSERIEDSDEEAEGAEELVAKPKEQVREKLKEKVKEKAAPASKTSSLSSNVKRKPEHDLAPTSKPASVVSSPNPKKPVHKSSLSNSSSSSHSGNEASRPATGVTSKSLKPHTHKTSESSASRISPRPRHDSSPQKPSPLGSSPPTTSTDLENSGSSKASNQSSAPSSPPSSTDMPQLKQGNKYSPVISDKSRNASRGRSPAISPVKRKAGPADDERPAKRPQSTSTLLAPLSNGTAESLKRPAPTRTDSDRSTSPEKPGPNRTDVMEDARRFQKYYKRYKDLYDKISQVDEKDRDDKDMGDLWKMHKRLKEMKADIWNNWGKVEKIDNIDKVHDAREMVAV